MRHIGAAIGLFVLSLAAAFFGLSYSYHDLLEPKRPYFGEFHRIHRDGWIEIGSELQLENLASRGNRIEIEFNPWRPAGNPPAHIKAYVCGELASEFRVTDSTPQVIYLTGTCEPRVVSFEPLNPFIGPGDDLREKGAQIVSATIRSRLGPPLLDPWLTLEVASLLFVLVYLVYRTFSAAGGVWFALVAALAGFALLEDAKYLDLDRVFPVWLLSLGLVVGLALASHLRRSWFTPTAIGHLEPPNFSYIAFLVVALAAFLRFYGIQFGLPANYHPDEVPKVNAIMRMVGYGDLNPRYFLHPSLLLYSTYFTNHLLQWIGVPGSFQETAFFAGRLVSAVAGVFSVYFTFLIGRRLYGRWAGLTASLLLAVFPLHVTSSRYLKEDSLLLFCILACTLAMIKAVQDRKGAFLLLSGLFAGLALSTKYSGLLAVVIVASAPWFRSRSWLPDREYLLWTIFGLGFVPVGFVLGTPYSVLDSAKFIKDFKSEKRHMLRGHTITIDAWSQYWMYHYRRSIIPGTHLVTAFVGTVGLGIYIWRRRVEDLLILGALLLFYLPAEWVKAKPAPQPERYIYPCLPFLAVAAAEALRVLSQRGRLLALVIGVTIIALPLNRTVELASEIPVDTRDEMTAWMKANLPHGSKVYLDWKPYAPRFFEEEFEVTYIPRARILSHLNINELKRSGQDYLVLSGLFYDRYFNQPNADAAPREQVRRVFRYVPIVKEFSSEHGTYGFHNPRLTLFDLSEEAFAKLEVELAEKARGAREYTTNEKRSGFRG